MISAADAAAFFERYDGFGERRAGSDADLQSARWLAAALGEVPSLSVRMNDVPFKRFVPGMARIETMGRVVEGLPLFDGGLTGPAGVAGTLGPLGTTAAIGFAPMEPSAASLPGNAFARERAGSRHRALVITLATREGGLAPLNAHDLEQPFGPPVLQVAGRETAVLQACCDRAEQAKVTVDGRHEDGHSLNVRAERGGGAAPLLLLTPRTSWWTSTAERAGGILAWCEALRVLAQATDLRRGVVGLATCGHELGHIGAHRAFALEPHLVQASPVVIHLGANLGAADAPALTVRSNVEGLATQMAGHLIAAGYPAQAIMATTGGKAGGEAHEVEQRGGRYLSLIGSNPWFHAPEDRWPRSIDLPRAAAVARAVAEMALAQARG